MTNNVVKSKVNLSMNMFSLQVGKKQVHFADTSITLNSKQSLLLKKGTGFGQIIGHRSYLLCKLFFFLKKLMEFLQNTLKNSFHHKDEILIS
jgi:hypothetical protein